MIISENTLEPAPALAHGRANTRAVPLVRKNDAHQGRVFFLFGSESRAEVQPCAS
jgi:hypothetical protein